MKISFGIRELTSLISLLLFTSCGGNGTLLPSSTGTPYEILVIMERNYWENNAGRALFSVLDSDMEGLPQSEPNFKISYATPDRFKSLLKPVRNIVIATIDKKMYTKAKMTYSRDLWATNQLVLHINAPDSTSFADYVNLNKQSIIDVFVSDELLRRKKIIERKNNKTAAQELKDHLNIKMKFPNTLKYTKKADGFFWISNGQSERRQDIVVYTYPYTDQNTFTADYLLHKRDSVMKLNIPGGIEGSYMGTQDVYPVFTRPITLNGRFCVEQRGLWNVVGDNMGGPFVSYTQLDEENKRIITVEAFVYNPSSSKRSLMRSIEAALLTLEFGKEEELLQLPNDTINK